MEIKKLEENEIQVTATEYDRLVARKEKKKTVPKHVAQKQVQQQQPANLGFHNSMPELQNRASKNICDTLRPSYS